jgi:hypothetical protein
MGLATTESLVASLLADALLVVIGEAVFPCGRCGGALYAGPPSMRKGPVAIDGTYEG